MNVEFQHLSPIFWKARLTDCGETVPIHFLEAPDHGPAHDHPLDFTIIVLRGGYVEHRYRPDGSYEEFVRRPGDKFVTEAHTIHRIVSMLDGLTVTAVVEGELCNAWAFYEWRDGVMFRKQHDQPDWLPVQP